ncbi:MAG: hypothetical protein A3B38_02235 [Candidatus Levybacteria bacterium RIFCSPLOWO2_01_FULL_36_13]|nr:MAG: hypothetical protein A2684_03465 [Candidatus Levybacteria bacterium RIFCSPHIGHO2_01_FULL_36_15b]OGH35680.1 MAG: hypothetical protein A3B38_02235 [Candidatus Levybacteria bacterium RIFCSPLOWO2_01_FULL_36_13]
MESLKKLFPFFLIIILSFFAIRPLLLNGFFPMHDDTQPSRVFEMASALKDGMVPVRWSADLGFGYGYPIFNFYAPFAYYTGAVINLLGLNPLDATKAMMIIGIILAGISMYLLAKEFFGRPAGLVAGLLYLYAPYHAVNIYVRGDVAEFYAYGFVPLVFLGLYKIYKENLYKHVFLVALFFALVIISHNLTAFIITPFYLLFSIFLFIKNKNRANLFIALGLGVLLSSFYSLPAILEMNYTNVVSQVGGGANFRDHFVCLSQFWTSQWGFGGSAKGCIDGISFMIGKYHILASVLSILATLFLLLKRNFKVLEKDTIQIVTLFLSFLLLSVFLMLSASQFIWDSLPAMEYIQYPWRFLLIASFSVSFLSGGLFLLLKQYINPRIYMIVIFSACIAVVFLNFKFFSPQTILAKDSSDYVSKNALNWDISKITSEYMPKKFMKPKNISQIANLKSVENNNIRLESYSKKTNRIELNLRTVQKTNVVVPLAYFPAWRAYLNGREVSTKEATKGTSVQLVPGKNNLVFAYKETKTETIGNILSISGIVLLALGIIKRPR